MKILKNVTIFLATCIILSACVCKDTCKNSIEKFENSKHKITLEESYSLYNNYRTRFRDSIEKIQIRDIDERKKYDPTQYVLINIDTLECYLKFLRKVEQKNNYGEKKITGIAIFLGANNKDAQLNNKAAFNKNIEKERKKRKNIQDQNLNQFDIKGRMTLFFAPTFRSSNLKIKNEIQRHIPFYIKPDNKEKDPYVGDYMNLMTKLESNINVPEKSINGETNETSLNLNEFTDMPPEKPANFNSSN